MLVFDTLLQFMGIFMILTLIGFGWPFVGRAVVAVHRNLTNLPTFPTTRVGRAILKITRGAAGLWLILPTPIMELLVIGLSVLSFMWLVGTHLIHPGLTVEVGGGFALLMCVLVGLCGVAVLLMLLLAGASSIWQCLRFALVVTFVGYAAVGILFASDGFLLSYIAFSVSTGACAPMPHLTTIIHRMWMCLLLSLACFATVPYLEAMGGEWGDGSTVTLLRVAKCLFILLATLQGLCVVVGFGCMFGFIGWFELAVHLYSTWTPFVVDPSTIDALMYHHIVHVHGVGSNVIWDATYYRVLVGGGSFFI